MFEKMQDKFGTLLDSVNKSASDLSLADEVEKILNGIDEVNVLLNKLEIERPSLDEAGYDNLKNRYEKRLNELENLYSLKKRNLDSEMKALIEKVDDYDLKIQVTKNELEDLKIRYKLGEFDTKEYESQRKNLLTRAGKYMGEKESANKKISRYEQLIR